MKNNIVAKKEFQIGDFMIEKGDTISIGEIKEDKDYLITSIEKFIKDKRPMPVDDLKKVLSQLKQL